MKIANKISVSFLITALLVTCIAAAVAYCVVKDKLEEAIFAHLRTAAKSRADHIETFLEIRKDALVQLSQSVVIEKLLKANRAIMDYKDKLDTVILRLEKTKGTHKAVHEMFVLDTSGKVIASSNKDYIGLDKSTNAHFLAGRCRKPYRGRVEWLQAG